MSSVESKIEPKNIYFDSKEMSFQYLASEAPTEEDCKNLKKNDEKKQSYPGIVHINDIPGHFTLEKLKLFYRNLFDLENKKNELDKLNIEREELNSENNFLYQYPNYIYIPNKRQILSHQIKILEEKSKEFHYECIHNKNYNKEDVLNYCGIKKYINTIKEHNFIERPYDIYNDIIFVDSIKKIGEILKHPNVKNLFDSLQSNVQLDGKVISTIKRAIFLLDSNKIFADQNTLLTRIVYLEYKPVYNLYSYFNGEFIVKIISKEYYDEENNKMLLYKNCKFDSKKITSPIEGHHKNCYFKKEEFVVNKSNLCNMLDSLDVRKLENNTTSEFNTKKSTIHSKDNTVEPSVNTAKPSVKPSVNTIKLSVKPSVNTIKLSVKPSVNTVKQSVKPSVNTAKPSVNTIKLSVKPSVNTAKPSVKPSSVNTAKPSVKPSSVNTVKQSKPSSVNTAKPSVKPSVNTAKPSVKPSSVNTVKQSKPSSVNTAKPSVKPSANTVIPVSSKETKKDYLKNKTTENTNNKNSPPNDSIINQTKFTKKINTTLDEKSNNDEIITEGQKEQNSNNNSFYKKTKNFQSTKPTVNSTSSFKKTNKNSTTFSKTTVENFSSTITEGFLNNHTRGLNFNDKSSSNQLPKILLITLVPGFLLLLFIIKIFLPNKFSFFKKKSCNKNHNKTDKIKNINQDDQCEKLLNKENLDSRHNANQNSAINIEMQEKPKQSSLLEISNLSTTLERIIE